jgi:hypothetical protein
MAGREIWRIGGPDGRSRRAPERAHPLVGERGAQKATMQMGCLDAKDPVGLSGPTS